MADIFPSSLAFAGFCRKVKRTISMDHTECASKQLSEHTKRRPSKKRSLSPHSPSPSLSSRYSSDTPSKSSAHASSLGSNTRCSTPRSPAIVSSDRESPSLQESGDRNLGNGLTNNAFSRESGRVSATAPSSSLPSASRRRRSSAPSSSTLSAVGTRTITTTTSTTSTKPILFINNIAPVVPRPKPSMTIYVQSQSALQQKVRKQLREQGKIKRSSNCFIKYRTYMHPFIVAKYGNQNNKEISKLAGRSWRNEPEHIKAIYRQQASEEKQRHESLFPSYVYTPARHNHRKDCSNRAPECPSAAKSPSPTSAVPARSGTHSNSHTTGSHVESGMSHESVKRSKTSRRTHGSSSTSSRAASERPTFAEKPFVVTETPLHDFNGDSDLTAHKRPSSKSRRQKGSNVKKSGSVVSTECMATTTSTLRSDPPSFVEPSCHPISSTVVPMVCAIDLPSAQSAAHEEVWMELDLSQDCPNSERSEVWSSVFPSSLGYPLSLLGRTVTPGQAPILSTRPISVPGHHHQSLPQHNNSTQPIHILEQSFTFPQVQETSLLTKPLSDNSFHHTFPWDLSAALPGSLDSPTYDYSCTSVDASMPLFSNQNLPVAAATVTASPQDCATPLDSTKGDFAHFSWLADTSHDKEWPSSWYSFSMAIAAPNVAPPSSSSPGSSSSLLSPPGVDYQVDTISASMAPPPLPPTYDGLFDGIASKNAPLDEWSVPGAASGLGDPMTGDLIATAAIAHTTDNNHNHNHQSNYNNDSRQDGGFCYINSGSSNQSSNSNSSMNGPRSIIQQPLYDYRQQQQQQTSPAYVDGGVHGCSDDELQRSIEFYERVLEQQKFQLSMQRQIRLQTEQQQQAPAPPPQQQLQQQEQQLFRTTAVKYKVL